MKEVRELLPDVLKSARGELLEKLIFAMWNHIVGDGVSHHSLPLRFHHGILTIAVPTEAWKKQLESMRGILIDKINAQLKQRKLGQVEFVVRADDKLSAKKATHKTTSPLPAESYAHSTIEQAVEIRDEELRELFTRIAVQNLNLQSSKKTKR